MSAASDTRRDLIRKLELEKKLERGLSKINNKIIDGTIREFNDRGLSFDAFTTEDDLVSALKSHYEKTAEFFSTQLTQELPSDILITQAEETLIEEALNGYYGARSAEQANIITTTTQKNIDNAIAAARQTRDEAGQVLSQREQAREAGARVSRNLKGRQKSIATTETQNAAEAAKATEAEILSGKTASVIAGSAAFGNIPKEWVTVGDQNVRDSHVAADSQVVDISSPFRVGGQLLRYPGDTSLGASAANVINCRCSSIYDATAVFAVRRNKGRAPFIQTDPSEQLLESIGL